MGNSYINGRLCLAAYHYNNIVLRISIDSCDYKNPTNIDIKLSMGLLLNYYTNKEGIMGSTVIVFYVIGAVLVLTIALVLIMILFGMRY